MLSMGIAGSGIPPYPLFDQALRAGNLGLAENIARERGQVTLGDALRILELMARHDDPRYERAAVKWLGRYATEQRGVTLGNVAAAGALLDQLPDRPDVFVRLRRLVGPAV
jgi:hypothetical protein